jgi:hypothetical protein
MRCLAALTSLLLLCACTTNRSTSPVRTATEELLISTAADRAAAELSPGVPPGTKVYLDTKYFEGYDQGYAIGAIRDQLLRHGVALVDTPAHADAIIFVRAGALSTDQRSVLIGVPQLQFPFIPVGNSITVPEIALFKTAEDKGVAKFAMTGYDAKTGKLISSSDPQYGFAHLTNHTVLLFFTWHDGDLFPPGLDENALSFKTLSSMVLPDYNLLTGRRARAVPKPVPAKKPAVRKKTSSAKPGNAPDGKTGTAATGG